MTKERLILFWVKVVWDRRKIVNLLPRIFEELDGSCISINYFIDTGENVKVPIKCVFFLSFRFFGTTTATNKQNKFRRIFNVGNVLDGWGKSGISHKREIKRNLRGQWNIDWDRSSASTSLRRDLGINATIASIRCNRVGLLAHRHTLGCCLLEIVYACLDEMETLPFKVVHDENLINLKKSFFFNMF